MVSERTYAAVVTGAEDSGDESTPENGGSPVTPAASLPNFYGEDFQNPLYLHVTENSNLVLVSPPLTENNYSSWSRSMQMALEVKNKFGLVDGTIPAPDKGNPQYLAWKRCNIIVCAWILNSLSPTIAESVLYHEKARQIWIDLEKRFSQSDPHKIAEVQNQIYNARQGNLSVNEFYTKCQSLWEKLSVLRPLPICNCVPRCSCDLISKIIKEREDDRVIRFLEGLNEDYEPVKSNVLVSDPILDFDKVFKMAVKLERKLNKSSKFTSSEMMHANSVQAAPQVSSKEEGIIAATGYGYSGGFSGKKKPKCTYCGKDGHTVEKCYKKHGFPPGWIPNYKNKGKFGQNEHQASNSVNQVGNLGITVEQLQNLMSLLQGKAGQGISNVNPSSAAAVTFGNPTLKADFKPQNEEFNEGSSWSDSWFC